MDEMTQASDETSEEQKGTDPLAEERSFYDETDYSDVDLELDEDETDGDDVEPSIEVVDVTPELAAEWLEKNTHNRNLRNNYIETLAMAMVRGEWQFNGDAIRISRDDVVLDGQHRMWALVLAGSQRPDLTIRQVVVTGLPPETQETMDTGAKRTLADTLRLRGETDASTLAAVLVKLHVWRQGEPSLRTNRSHVLTTPQALALLDREPEVREAIRVARRIRTRLGDVLPVTLVAACLYRFDQIDREDSLRFWQLVSTGENVSRGHPCYELRQALTKNASRRHKLPQLDIHALIIKAWNAFREGRPVQVLRWKPGGAKPEKFPEPV